MWEAEYNHRISKGHSAFINVKICNNDYHLWIPCLVLGKLADGIKSRFSFTKN